MQKTTKFKASPLECVLRFKAELLALKAVSQNSALQNSNHAVASPANNPPATFADQYFQHALASYLELVALVEPIVTDPIKNRAQILSLSPESLFVQTLLAKCIGVGTLGLPHLFHPLVNPETQVIQYEGDPRCYRLAQLVRDHLCFVLKADLGIIFSILNGVTPVIKNGLRYLISVIEGRIARFEYNERYRATLTHYNNNIKPTLQETISNLQDEAWDTEELAQLLQALTQIAEHTYQHQAVIPLFLRDNPLCQHNDETLKDYDRYPTLLRAFLPPNSTFYQTAVYQYAECLLVENIELGLEAGTLLDSIIEVIERKQTVALRGGCSSEFNFFKEKVLILRKRNHELTTHKEMLDEDVPEWSVSVCSQLNVLIKQLKTYCNYNPDGLRLKITTSQIQLHQKSKFCRHLYHELLRFEMQIEIQPELRGHVQAYLLCDLLAQTTPLISETRRVLEAQGLTDNDDYRAILAYLKATAEYLSLLSDLVTNLQAVVQEDLSLDLNNPSSKH